MVKITQIKSRFLNSLKRGTGEAYILAIDNPLIDFSSYIIKGALKNYAYDGQSEPSRAQYIFDLIETSDKKDKIKGAILKGLADEQEDTWSLTHLFDLAKLLAQHGDDEAKRAIYNRFLNHPIEGSDWVGFHEILELDGLAGLTFIAEKFGRWIEQNPGDIQDSMIIGSFQDDNPSIDVNGELEKAAEKNKYIKIYLDNIAHTHEMVKLNRPNSKQYTNIIDEVIDGKLPYRKLKELQANELGQLAERLVIEKSKNNQEKLLRIFGFHKFPLDSEFILKLAKQKPSSRNSIREFAIYALNYLGSENIRQFALDMITSSSKPHFYTNLLTSNYRKGDCVLLSEVVCRFRNEHTIEHLSVSYVDIYTTNNTKECREPLEILYGKMNCGIHRNEIIGILLRNKVLSDKLMAEIKYDSYLDTRGLTYLL